MMKKEILVVGNVSYKIISGLNDVYNGYSARKSNIGGDDKSVNILDGYPPDIIVMFLNNSDTKWRVRIKMAFDKLNYKNIPIICVGNANECSLLESTFTEYQVQKLLLPFSIVKLNKLIRETLDENINDSFKTTEQESDYNLSDYYENMKKHILVVDDDVKTLRLISGYLKDIYKVSVVNSGAAAIAFLGKKKPDLILLDYLMPVCNGIQVLQMIRDLKDMQNIPVIFLTGVSDKDVVKQCLQLNPQGYLLKPIAKENLMNRLNEVFHYR